MITNKTKREECASCRFREGCFIGRFAIRQTDDNSSIPILQGSVDRNVALYRTGDKPISFYILRSGCIKEVSPTEPDGSGGFVFDFCLPGEVMGLYSPIRRKLSIAGIALESSDYCEIQWHDLRRMQLLFPDSTLTLIQSLAESAASKREFVTVTRRLEALNQVAAFILHIAARFRKHGMPSNEFKLSMSRDDIANYLGLTSETVSRSFSQLKLRGIINVKAKNISLLQPNELARLANF